MVGPVEIEIMGTAAYFRAFITYVRGFFSLAQSLGVKSGQYME